MKEKGFDAKEKFVDNSAEIDRLEQELSSLAASAEQLAKWGHEYDRQVTELAIHSAIHSERRMVKEIINRHSRSWGHIESVQGCLEELCEALGL